TYCCEGIIFFATATHFYEGTMGRKALAIEYIPKSAKRKHHFDNRIPGVFKKAYQISQICGVPFSLAVENEDGTLYYRNNLDISGSLCDAQRSPNKIKLYNPETNKFDLKQSIPNLTSSCPKGPDERKVAALISELEREIAPKQVEEWPFGDLPSLEPFGDLPALESLDDLSFLEPFDELPSLQSFYDLPTYLPSFPHHSGKLL
ncbi:hypothetical protein KI387_033649, partial [Taxus chinensis]